MAPTAVADRPGSELESRIVDAMLECIGRWGLGKTTADDIARSAGISRATLYRVFPGGKEVALDALLRREMARFFASVTGPLEHAESLEDVIAIAFVEAARFLLDHEPLQYLLTHEPERFHLASTQPLGSAYPIATAFAAPLIEPYLADPGTAPAAADWVVRQFFSYALVPSPDLRITDEADVRRFVRTYVLPALTPQGA